MNLEPFIRAVEKEKLRVEGLVVFQRGREAARHFWTPLQRRNVRSVAKSFLSAALGMAIDEGKLKLSDKVTRTFTIADPPDPVQKARWDALTLEHLLTMTMGHAGLSRPQSVKEALSYELSREPGSVFSYDNTCAFLASAMLAKAVGCNTRDYLLDRLFRPLGIIDPEWTESSDGCTLGSTGLFINTCEMALFGQFLLQRGCWKGKQLVSAAWIDAATRAQIPTRRSKDDSFYSLGYGYYFWIGPDETYRCDGTGGQFIIVFPALDAVAAISSDEENMKGILKAVWDYVLPELMPAKYS